MLIIDAWCERQLLHVYWDIHVCVYPYCYTHIYSYLSINRYNHLHYSISPKTFSKLCRSCHLHKSIY